MSKLLCEGYGWECFSIPLLTCKCLPYCASMIWQHIAMIDDSWLICSATCMDCSEGIQFGCTTVVFLASSKRPGSEVIGHDTVNWAALKSTSSANKKQARALWFGSYIATSKLTITLSHDTQKFFWEGKREDFGLGVGGGSWILARGKNGKLASSLKHLGERECFGVLSIYSHQHLMPHIVPPCNGRCWLIYGDTIWVYKCGV